MAERGWLLDTNVVSETRKGGRAAVGVLRWLVRAEPSLCFISTATVAELEAGIAAAPADQVGPLKIWLSGAVRTRFADRTLAVDEPVLIRWLQLNKSGRQQNHTFPQPDALIAATALVHDLTVVTRNTRDFDRTGVRLLNPWETS